MLHKQIMLVSIALLFGLNLFAQEVLEVQDCTGPTIIEDCKVILKGLDLGPRSENQFTIKNLNNELIPYIQLTEECEIPSESCTEDETTYYTYDTQPVNTYSIDVSFTFNGQEFDFNILLFNNCPYDIELLTILGSGFTVEGNTITYTSNDQLIFSCKVCCDQMQFTFFNSAELEPIIISVYEFQNSDESIVISDYSNNNTGIPTLQVELTQEYEFYLIRYRKEGEENWQYTTSSVPVFELTNGGTCETSGTYEFQIQAMSNCEIFNWSELENFDFPEPTYPIELGNTYEVSGHFIANDGSVMPFYYTFTIDCNCQIELISHPKYISSWGNEIIYSSQSGIAEVLSYICCDHIQFHYSQLIDISVDQIPNETVLTGLNIYTDNSHSIIQFEPIPNAISYEIICTNLSNGYTWDFVSSDPFFEITSTDPCGEYIFQIRAIGECYTFEWSNFEYFEWFYIEEIILTGLSFELENNLTIIQFDLIPNVESYQIRYKNQGEENWNEAVTSYESYFEIINNVRCNKFEIYKYEFQIRLLQNDCGISTWSPWSNSYDFELYCNTPIVLAPNPVSDDLYITTDVPVELLSINNIYGKIDQPINTTIYTAGSTNRIDVSKLQHGYYYITFRSPHGLQTLRFIKY